MARKLSVRKTGAGSFVVGPQGHGKTVVVRAADKREALRKGKARLRADDDFAQAVAGSFRCYMRKGERTVGNERRTVSIVMNTCR